MSDQSIAKKIIRGMIVVLFFWLFWKFGGFLLGIIIGYLYPPGREPAADAYSHVFKYIIFTFIYSTSLRVLVPSFMPVFIERLKEEDEREAWEFAYSVLNITILISLAGSALAMVFAPQIINLMVPGFTDEARALGVTLLQIMLPGSVGMVLSMVMMAILNSYKNFGYPAASDAAQKLFWAVALFVGVKLLHMDARIIGYGFLAGCILQVLINVYGLRSQAKFYKLRITTPSLATFLREIGIILCFGVAFAFVLYLLRDNLQSTPDQPSIGQLIVFTAALIMMSVYVAFLHWRTRNSKTIAARFAALAAPLLLGVLFSCFRDVATSFFQSFTQTGVYASVEFARNIGNFPTVLVAYGLSIAMFPYLCELAAGKDMETFASIVTRAIRMIALFFIPLSVFIILLDRPIVSLVYDRGNWSNHHIAYAGTTLSFFVLGLFFYAIEGVLMRAYFSIQRMWMPTFLGLLFSALQVAFLVFVIMTLGLNHPHHIFLAVAVAFPFTRILKNIALLAMLRIHVPIMPLKETLSFAGKLTALCLIFALAVQASHMFVSRLLPAEEFKKLDVVVDTFRLEHPDWISRETDRIAIQKDDEHGAMLVVHYRTLASERITIDRELDQFRLDDVHTVQVSLKASEPRKAAVEVVFPRSTWLSEPFNVSEEWQLHSLSIPSKGERPRELRIILPPDGSPSRSQELFVSDLRFIGVNREYLIDNFALRPPAWSNPETGGAVLTSYDTATRAVVVGNHGVIRDISAFDLSRSSNVQFSAIPPGAGHISVALTDASGQIATRIFETSDRRERTFRGPYDSFEGSADLNRLEFIHFDFVPAAPHDRAGPLMINSLSFNADRRFLKGTDPVFEIVKLVGIAVPAFLGGIIFIIFVFVLKIEEGRLILDWVREQMHSKLGRFRKPASSE